MFASMTEAPEKTPAEPPERPDLQEGDESVEPDSSTFALPSHVPGSGTLDRLVETARDYARQAASVNTLKAYAKDWAQFARLRRMRGAAPLPPSPGLIGIYIADLAKPGGNLQRFILPALGQLTVTGVTRADVAKFHHDLRHIPYQANRCLEVISKMFSLSEMWGLRPDGTNPRKHIRKYPEEKRERFLSAAELRWIGEVLREMEAESVELPSAILAARLLILTGCRLNEIMSLKWSYIDFDSPALHLPDSKTGAKVVRVGQPVVDLLREAQRTECNPAMALCENNAALGRSR
jgi:integrase